MKYLISPSYCVFASTKIENKNLARDIIKTFYPGIEQKIQGASFPSGKTVDNSDWSSICPQADNSSEREILLIIREPVNRFLCSMSQYGLTDIDEVMSSIENNTKIILSSGRNIFLSQDKYFTKQVSYLIGSAYCYRADRDLEDFASKCGIQWPMSSDDIEITITPTESQVSRILSYYDDDKQLYDSITSSGIQIDEVLSEAELSKRLSDKKSVALKALDDKLVEDSASGIIVDASDITSIGKSIRMRTADDARANYHEIKSLIDLAGDNLPYVSAWDADGNQYNMTKEEALILLSRYAVGVAVQRSTYFTSQMAIINAESL
jgi:hypothetical protein